MKRTGRFRAQHRGLGLILGLCLATGLPACDQDRALQSPRVRPSLEGSLEVMPLLGFLASTIPLTGFESGYGITLESGVSPSPSALVWHRFGKGEQLIEVAWPQPRSGADGDEYEFHFRTYDDQKVPMVETRKILFTGTREVVYLRGPHEFTLEPGESPDDSQR